jgi:hypothetical protein
MFLLLICNQWVNQVYVPYVKQVIAEEGLKEDQKSILYIDCYPVHTGQEFRKWMRSEHPNIFVIYVPASCKLIDLLFTV